MVRARYEVRVSGWVSERVRSAFSAMDFQAVPPQTIMFGEVIEQSDLYGLLAQCSAMGLEVISLERLPDPSDAPARSPAGDEVATVGCVDPGPPGTRRHDPERRPRRRGREMSIGPVQLIVLGFPEPDFHGGIITELERLRESDTVRVIDALAVHKDANGEVEVAHLSNLTDDEAVELGSKVGALIGLGIEGEAGIEPGAEAGAAAAASGARVFSDEDAWDVLEDIPNGSAAALLLLEHAWAVPLRDAVAAAGGYRIGDAFISPLDLVGIGMVSAQEATDLHDLETAGVGAR
ncbi:hypothetical protein GCM10009609_39160 [Pseudonocardia aurantiaca]|uniref:DUF1269 domain-containing protein n=1 Tax=Pseudonocardia aurantiaca TaxID=75290 RepID=A0ABW4FJ75_9PSEU